MLSEFRKRKLAEAKQKNWEELSTDFIDELISEVEEAIGDNRDIILTGNDGKLGYIYGYNAHREEVINKLNKGEC